MIKILSLLCFSLLTLFGAGFGREFALPVLQTDGQSATINASDLKPGESGVIVRWLDSEHATILANAVVTEIKNEKAIVRFEPYAAVEQDAFPSAKILPRKNDEAILRRFYDRGLIIAPNQQIYQKIAATYKDVSWTHPDLLASYLIDEGALAPRKKDFRGFCNAYTVGVIYIVNGTKGQAYDCKTFKMLKEDYVSGMAKIEDRMQPFYSRLGNIEADWYSFLSGEMGDFYNYYSDLLDGTIPDDEESFWTKALHYIY